MPERELPEPEVGDIVMVTECPDIDVVFHGHTGRVTRVDADYLTVRMNVEILCKREELEKYDEGRHGYT